MKKVQSGTRLRLTDIKKPDTEHEWQSVDVTCYEQVLRATEGVDAILNLSVLRD